MSDRLLFEGLSSIYSVGRATIANTCGGGGEPPQRPSAMKLGSFYNPSVSTCRRRKDNYDDELYVQAIKRHQELDEELHRAKEGQSFVRRISKNLPRPKTQPRDKEQAWYY